MTLDELYSLAENSVITVDNVALSEVAALSLMDSGGDCFIAIDTRQINSRIEEKCALAHEMGHCEAGAL